MEQVFSVVTTGKRTAACSNDEILAVLRSLGDLTDAQRSAVLKGVPSIIQQVGDLGTANLLAEALNAIGLMCQVVESHPKAGEGDSSVPSEQPSSSAPRTTSVRALPPAAQHDTLREHIRQSSYSRDDILKGFKQGDEFAQQSIRHKTRMLVSALSILMLPMLFLSTLFCLSATLFALVQNFQAMATPDLVLLYGNLGGAVMTACLMLALIYRALGDWKRDRKYVALNRDEQPQLYTLVDKLAERVGIEPPAVIKLDAEVGTVLKSQEVFGAIGGRRTELIIGLPVIYSLNVRQLSGVIVHAFAGFNKEARHLGYPLVTAVSAWLYRAAQEQRNGQASSGWRHHPVKTLLRLPGYLLLPFDKLAQLYFVVLHRLASAVSFAVNRQMDMVADLYSANVSGSSEFRTTQFRLRALHYGQQHAYQHVMDSSKQGKLAKNYPALVADYANSMRIELKPKLIEEMEELVTPLTRSRVVDLGRIVNVERHQFEGVCYLLGASSELINDLDTLSQVVTDQYYVVTGITQQTDADLQVDDRARLNRPTPGARIAETFLGWQISKRFLRVDDVFDYEHLSRDSRRQDLQDVVSKLSVVHFKVKSMAIRYCQLEERIDQLHLAKTLKEAGLEVRYQDELSGVSGLREIETVWLRALNEQGALKGDLSYYEALLSRRIALALSLAKDNPDISRRTGIDSLTDWIELAVDALTFLHKSYESIVRLRTYALILGDLIKGAQSQRSPAARQLLERYFHYCQVEISSVLSFLGAVAYPLTLPKQLEVRHEYPSIAIVMKAQIPGLDRADVSVAQGYRSAMSVLAFIDKLTDDLYAALDRVVQETEQAYDVTVYVNEPAQEDAFKRGSWQR